MSHKARLNLGRVTLIAGCALTLGVVASRAQAGKDPFGGRFNHYQCYQIVDGGSGLTGVLKLQDQFGAGAAKIGKPTMLCNPVDKNGEGIPAKQVHLVCYTIEPDRPAQKIYGVEIQNQLEATKYYVKGPQILCVPSTKVRLK